MGAPIIDANFEKVNQIRKCPKTFFAKYEYTEETYYLDILKELCEEYLGLSSKIHLLSLLEQNSDLLLVSLDEIEQTAGSLLAIYSSTPGDQETRPGRTLAASFKGQILHTLTSILLARQNQNDSEMLFSDLVAQLKDVLLDTAIGHHWPTLKTTACICLTELEAFFPGVLASNREQLVAQQNNAPSWQCLLGLCGENDLRALDHLERKEKFKYYAPIEALSSPDQSLFTHLVKQAAANITWYPSHIIHSLVSRLWTWTMFQPQLPSSDLESLVPHLTSSYDFLLLDLALKMLENSSAMVDQLIRLPFLVSRRNRSQQLLCLEWLASYITHHQAGYNQEHLIALLAFSPFEGPDTHEKKLRILSSIPPSTESSSHNLEGCKRQMILQGLQLLERSSSSAKKTTRPIGSLFRSLAFHLDSSQAHVGDLDHLISGRVLPFVLDSSHSPALRSKLWLHCLNLIHHTLGKSQPLQLNKMFLAYLHQLVDRGEPQKNPDQFLAVVRTILAHQHFHHFKNELEYLLFKFGTKISESSSMAVGRSKLFFTALRRLPPARLQKHLLCSSSPPAPLAEVCPAPKYKTPYADLPEPYFTIKQHPTKFLKTNEAELPVFSPDRGKDLLQSYQDHLASIRPVLSLTYQLVACPKLLEKTEPLFAVVISLEGKPATSNKIKDFIIPCLQPQKLRGPWEPTFLIHPQHPRPLFLLCRCRFSTPGLEDAAGMIGSDLLPFSSIFLHLPTDKPRELFDVLWDLCSAGTTPGHLAATQMINKPWTAMLDLAERHWGRFSVPREEEEGCRDFGILLACGSHLLLRLKPATDPFRTTLSVAADHPDTLGCFHTYLSTLLAAS